LRGVALRHPKAALLPPPKECRRRHHDHRRRRRLERLRRPRPARLRRRVSRPLRPLHRRKFVEPIKGGYFENITPVTGKPFCEVGRGTVEDIDRAVDVAWKAFESWKRTTPAERANILNKIADRMEANLERSPSPRRGRTASRARDARRRHPARDRPLPLLRRRAPRAGGSLSQIDEDTVAYHFHEPLGVVGQIIPWNFPILMATGSSRPRSPRATASC
jgi:acyl-CoA reductase-like NAD-dependent aldehyde dehydrogenase